MNVLLSTAGLSHHFALVVQIGCAGGHHGNECNNRVMSNDSNISSTTFSLSRIVIVGCPVAGKSSLAVALYAMLSLPIVQRLHLTSGFVARTQLVNL